MYDIVANLEQVLGAPLTLIPWPRGVKGTSTPWGHLGPENLEDPAFQKKLSQGNIGVALGSKSGGLCSIDVDDDVQLARLLQLNPKLSRALRTRGRRGANIWVRMTGPYPRSAKLRCGDDDIGEWRADGNQTIIHGIHPDTKKSYVRLVDAAPASIPWEEIVWPTDWQVPELGHPVPGEADDLARKYGPPFAPGRREGEVGALNERYWAGLFAAEHRVIHDPASREFYRYDPATGLWAPKSVEWIREQIAQRLSEVADDQQQPDLKLKAVTQRLTNTVNALRGIVESPQFFDDRPRIIHVCNGVIEVAEDGGMTFGDPKPEHRSRNRSPFSWDPAAECPRFLAFIRKALPEEDVQLFQGWLGVALSGFNLPQRIMLLDGGAGTGKSTLAIIVQRLVGPENCYQLRTEHLGERFEIYRYRGKTLLVGVDVPANFLAQKGASTLKALVGGDPLSAEGKGLNGDFPLRGIFNVLITSNSRLRIRLEGDHAAWRRRLIILRFIKPPPSRRTLNLAEELVKAEGPGILRWGLLGFVSAMRQFEATGDFALTQDQTARVDGLLMESDSLRLFLTQRVERRTGVDLSVNELVTAYAIYCAAHKWNVLPEQLIHRQLPDLMLELFQVTPANSVERQGRSSRGYRAVCLKNDDAA